MATVRGKAHCYGAHARNAHEARRLTAEKHGCPFGATYVIYRGSALPAATAGAHFIELPRRLSGRSGDDSTSRTSTSAAQQSRSRVVKRKRVASAPPSAEDVHDAVVRIPEFASIAGIEFPVWVMRGDPNQAAFMSA
jgi:hypothetical protein